MCHMRMRYEIKVINVGGFNIDDLEPDRQSAKFSGYTVYMHKSFPGWPIACMNI